MSVLEHSHRFMCFIGTQGREPEEILEAIAFNLKEIEQISGLDRRQLEALILHLDVSMINEHNCTAVIEMLDMFGFRQKDVIIKEVSRVCRMGNIAYDLSRLQNLSLRELLGEHTCIFTQLGKKCPNNEIALKRKHFYCLRQSFWDEAMRLFDRRESPTVREMLELGLVTLDDLIIVNLGFVYEINRDFAYSYALERTESAIDIEEFIRLDWEAHPKLFHKSIPLAKKLIALNEELSDTLIELVERYYSNNSVDPLFGTPLTEVHRQWFDEYIAEHTRI